MTAQQESSSSSEVSEDGRGHLEFDLKESRNGSRTIPSSLVGQIILSN